MVRRANAHDDKCTLVDRLPNIANHKVVSVTKITDEINVYDIEVPGLSNFVADGVVVHNSHASMAFIVFAIGYVQKVASGGAWRRGRRTAMSV